MHDQQSVHGSWSSRWVFILAATGSAVGLGNIWKFPYIVGENGGGAFVLVYLACIALVGVPIMMAEVVVGRRARQSPINAMREIAAETGASRHWSLVGWCGALAGFLIFAFYSVVSGWVLAYVFHAANGTFTGAGAEQVGRLFDNLLADPQALTIWHTVFVLLVMGVLARGVNRGLEQAIRVLMPSLFVLLLLLLMYALMTGAFSQGLDFLFSSDWSKLTWNSVLVALGHAFFTLSLGMGAIMVYGSYMPKKSSIAGTAMTVAALDTLVALVAGMAIFPVVFANDLDPGAGPGLMFVTLPVAFGHMAGGQVFGFLFFLMVAIAAWSSAISLMEPALAWLVERFKISRPLAALALAVPGWLLGLGALASFNIGSEWLFLGMTFFDLLDFVTANLMLPLGGLILALFVGWFVKAEISRDELAMKNPAWVTLWRFLLRFVAPAAVLVVFVASLVDKLGG
ncbi:sodium-dependent transporter [Motiliproteus sp. SC1-56]|uniref:sodium-dependent transporter n=1 Tax=Motiliproteus sp. SC1-56 TaxID=2799565 RepID=UPI001A8D7435|nr:sodium-dependent transporter [Motiliproteus sp. SC1-56]